jgi:pentatricopeptide repeat protein
MMDRMDTEFFTATMARVYAEQGHYEKAAEIYRHLLEREPDRREFLEAIADIEKKRKDQGPKTDSDLVPLIRKWIRLLLRYRQIRQLKRCRRNLPR